MIYSKIGLGRRKGLTVLALGAQSKGGFCFVKGPNAYLAQLEGDIDNPANFKIFQKKIKALKINPDIIACDLHPEYISTKLACDIAGHSDSKLKKIQHHEAHIASCIADNEIKGQVIGIAFDGTGFGLDGNIWGGDFFIGSLKRFKRAAHLRYIAMPGGEAAVKEPWRMAFSYLYNIYGEKIKSLKFSFLDNKDVGLLSQIIQKGINSPFTSSMGRLFDSVAAIIGIRSAVEYEGQAAIELEQELRLKIHKSRSKNKYNFRYRNKGEVIIIDWAPVIRGVVKDMGNKKDKREISLKFHNAVIDMIGAVCVFLREKYGIKKVCMSGGVFQNKYLASNVRPLLEEQGFEVYPHKRLPVHDGNIALGQAAIAAVQGEASTKFPVEASPWTGAV